MATTYDLSNKKSILKIAGTDAQTFIQGQVTCDVSRVQSGRGQLGALCNPKGRAICLFHVFKHEDTFYIVVEKSLGTLVLKRLSMFVFRSDVNLTDISESHSVYASSNRLESVDCMASCLYGNHLTIQLYLIEKASLTNNNKAIVQADANPLAWEKALNEACVPEITANTSELFIPQMLNLDVLGGISFKKGCYTGQEIIARLHYKGTVKRQLYPLECSINIPEGTDITNVEDNAMIGTIVSCTQKEDEVFMGTIVVKNTYVSEPTINAANYGTISIKQPPYSLEELET